MKIYTKILLTALPLLFISLLIAVGTTYYCSHDALTHMAGNWLRARMSEAVQAAAEREKLLHAYGLEEIAASVKQARIVAGAKMASMAVGEQGCILAVDSRGVITVHPDMSLVGRDVSGEKWFREMRSGREGLASYSLRGKDYLAVYEYFQPWQWYIMAADSKDEVYGVIYRAGPGILIILTCGSTVLAMVLMFIIRRLLAPLHTLETGARQFGQGNLEARVPVRSRDELGSLAVVFNNMAAQLQDTLNTLKHSEELFRCLIENSSDLITILSRDGLIRYQSPAIERLYGYGHEELIDKSLFDFIHPDDRTSLIEYLDQQIPIPGVTSRVELRVLHKNGSWRIVEAGVNNLLHDGLVLNSRDITERKQAEVALSVEKSILKDLLELTLSGYWDWNIPEDIEYLSPAFKRMFGYEDHELPNTPKTWQKLIFQEDLPGVLDNFDRHVKSRGEIPYYNEVRYRHKDGSTVWVICAGRLVEWNRDGSPVRMVGCHIDITGLKRTESINQARVRLLRIGATRTLGDLLRATLDETESLTGSLIGFCHFFDDDRKSLLLQAWSTRTLAEFCTAEGKGLHYDAAQAGVWADCIRERRPVIHNDYLSLSHRKGMPPRHAPVYRELVVPVMRGNKIVAILGVGNKPGDYTAQDVETVSLLADLTWEIAERKKAEQELEDYRMNLEDLVRQRTAALEESRVNALSLMEDANLQRQTAEEALAEKEVLLREVHHRVKNNLNTIATMLYFQAKKVNDAQAVAAFQESQNRIQSMARVHEHLYRSKSLTTVDMKGYLSDLVMDLGQSLGVRAVPIRLESEGVTLDVDRAMPCGLLINELVSNALKHAFGRWDKESTISVGLAQQDDEILLTVDDNGSGLPAGFDPDTVQSLGLRLVTMLVRQLRGTLEVESEEGKGTTFSISFSASL